MFGKYGLLKLMFSEDTTVWSANKNATQLDVRNSVCGTDDEHVACSCCKKQSERE